MFRAGGNSTAALNFKSNSSAKPCEEFDSDDDRPDQGDVPGDVGLPPGPGLLPKAPTLPATGRPQPRRSEDGISFVVGGDASAETILESTQVDRSELTWENLAGQGITAEVFKGMWRGKQVAIKRLNYTTRRTAQLKQEIAFLRETGVIAKISHENLVKFYGLAFDQQPYLLITEFCNGGTCYDLLHESDAMDLVINQQLKMCCDVACAMEYLHKFRPQIIHRDLKSLNLLLFKPVTSTSDVPHVKVSDFGLAKMKDKDTEWGKMTVEAGTFHWMAPEVATGNYDEKADIYSFAMVLFEFICQEIPFEDLEPIDVLKSTSSGRRPDMEAVPPTTPKALVDLMEQCWEHEASKRPSFEYICGVLDRIVRQVVG
jgi:serine/threonine protein kinase